MVAAAIDEASVLARFDRLVGDGMVLYTPDMEKIYYDDGGFKFEFRLTSALKTKPAAVEDNAELDNAKDADADADNDGPGSKSREAPQETSNKNGDSRGEEEGKDGSTNRTTPDGCLPGGDISIAGFEVADIRDTHVLAFNKFCAYRPHMLLLTADGERRQFEALGAADLEAAREVLVGMGGGSEQEYLVIFNCGKEGGCSRLHKHMQVIPAPGAIPMWPDAVTVSAGEAGRPPFRYLIHRFDSAGVPPAGELTAVYGKMLVEAARAVPGREAVVEEDGDGRGVAVPHNVILGRRWIVVVPRVKAGAGGADVNAAGVLGVVWVSGEETLKTWRELGGRFILGEVGVKR